MLLPHYNLNARLCPEANAGNDETHRCGYVCIGHCAHIQLLCTILHHRASCSKADHHASLI